MTAQIHKLPGKPEPKLAIGYPGDRHIIRTCATYVRGRLRDINASEAWIGIGEALSQLKGALKKRTPRGDNIHIGWSKAFELGEFSFSRETAEHLIAVFEFFTGNKLPIKNLPTSWGTLYAIATKLKPEVIPQLIEDGTLSPATTRREVNAMAKPRKLKSRATKQRAIFFSKSLIGKLMKESKQERITAIRDLLTKLELDSGDIK
jgi:hypothetical protein